jgi:SAP domain
MVIILKAIWLILALIEEESSRMKFWRENQKSKFKKKKKPLETKVIIFLKIMVSTMIEFVNDATIIKSMTVVQLRSQLRMRELPLSGRKHALAERLIAAIEARQQEQKKRATRLPKQQDSENVEPAANRRRRSRRLSHMSSSLDSKPLYVETPKPSLKKSVKRAPAPRRATVAGQQLSDSIKASLSTPQREQRRRSRRLSLKRTGGGAAVPLVDESQLDIEEPQEQREDDEEEEPLIDAVQQMPVAASSLSVADNDFDDDAAAAETSQTKDIRTPYIEREVVFDRDASADDVGRGNDSLPMPVHSSFAHNLWLQNVCKLLVSVSPLAPLYWMWLTTSTVGSADFVALVALFACAVCSAVLMLSRQSSRRNERALAVEQDALYTATSKRDEALELLVAERRNIEAHIDTLHSQLNRTHGADTERIARHLEALQQSIDKHAAYLNNVQLLIDRILSDSLLDVLPALDHFLNRCSQQ